MPESNFNKIFSEKFKNYEPSPENNRWNNIEAALDNKKKKRGGLWWFGLSFVAVSALVYLNLDKTRHLNTDIAENRFTLEGFTEEIKLKEAASSPAGFAEETNSDEKNTSSGSFHKHETPALANTPVANASEPLKSVPIQQVKEYSLPEESFSLTTPTAINTPDNQESENSSDPETLKDTTQEEEQTTVKIEDNKDEPVKKITTVPTANNAGKKEKEKYPVLNRLSISFGAGGGAFRHKIKMPATVGSYTGVTSEMVKGNYLLRKDMEKTGYYSTEMISFGIRLNDNFRIGSGIQLLQITQKMKFTAVQAQQDIVVGPTDFKESPYSSTTNNSYQFPNDSITSGNATTADNKYYYREIPLFIQGNFKINTIWNFTSLLGGSYRYLSGAVAYLPDVDNVGMVYFTTKKDYPGIKGTLNLFAGAGFEYKINEAYGLDAMLVYNHGLQSTIGFEHFVRQYQRNLGLNIRLIRYFSFE